MVAERFQEGQADPVVAVLFSSGLDSAVLLAEAATRATVQPIYVHAGLAWEEAEVAACGTLLSRPPFSGRVRPLAALTVDMRDVYPPSHWAVRGEAPAFDTPDEDVYLEGRNIVLIAKAGVLCARLDVGRLAMGPLAGNPFPDATPEFIAAMSQAMALGLDRAFTVVTPLTKYHKEDVVRIGLEHGVPLELTMSCMNPVGDVHCGRCSKCRERRDAFRIAGAIDKTTYDYIRV